MDRLAVQQTELEGRGARVLTGGLTVYSTSTQGKAWRNGSILEPEPGRPAVCVCVCVSVSVYA